LWRAFLVTAKGRVPYGEAQHDKKDAEKNAKHYKKILKGCISPDSKVVVLEVNEHGVCI
jgi:hypothetical protein